MGDIKKILYGITLSSIGGAQSLLYQLISNIDEEKYIISLVTSPGGELIDQIKGLNLNRENKINIIELKSLKRNISPLYDLISLFQLIRIIKKGRYDIVHLHSSKMGVIGSIASHICNVKKILFTVHGFGIEDKTPFFKKTLLSLAQKLGNRFITHTICVSEETRKEGLTKGFIKKNSIVILNGTSPRKEVPNILRKELNIGSSYLIIGTIMRLSYPKEPLFTIDVFNKLLKKGYRIKLVIIGDGPLYQKCLDHIKELNISSFVYLIGNRADARDLITDFNIFTLFSSSEALPMSIIEAMFAGSPIVANDVGGNRELVHNNINGFLVNLNLNESSNYIETLINSPNILYTFGLNSKAIAYKQFTSKKMAGEYEKIYRENISPKENGNLLKNFSYLFLGNMVYSLLKAGIILLLNKFGNPSLVGEYSLSSSLATPIFLFFGLGLRTVYISDRKNKYSFSDYFNLRVTLSTFALLLLILISLLFNLNKLLIYLSLWKFLEFNLDIVYGLFQKKNKNNLIGYSILIKSLFSFLLITIIFYGTRNLLLGILSICVVWVISILCFDIPKAYNLSPFPIRFWKSSFPSLMKISFPLGIVSVLDTISSYLPSYFIPGILGFDSLGYYSSISYLVISGDIIINSLGSACLPKLSLYYSNNKLHKYTSLLLKSITISLGFGISCLIIVTIFAGEILGIIFNTNYSKYYNIFILLMASSCILYISNIITQGINAAGKFKNQKFLSLFYLLLNIPLYYFLVKEYGLNGASYAALISSIIRLLGNLILIQRD